MSTSRLIRSLVAAAAICVIAGAGPGGGVRGQQPETPTFRTDASFVLTDVFVTADGKPVTDLTQADFEVREDGVVQTIRSFESVVHQLQPVGLPRRNPSTVAESNAMISDPRRRVYVVFLDTYHVDRGSAMYMRKALQAFFATAFGPDDLNAYYLLGYTSTNGKADGKYRRIKVTVKRPGVQVRAREGYLARRIDERPASSAPATPDGATPNAEAALFTAALGRLTPPRQDMPLVVSAVAGAVAGGTARAIRVTAELDARVAATPEWAEGGEAQAFVRNAKGDTLTSGKAALARGTRTVEIEVPVVEGMGGDVKVQVRLSGTGALARYTDTTSVALDAMPAGWGAPRLSRRGPSTGVAWVPTADPRFRRQERLRVSVGVGTDAGPVTGTLLDRQGRPINVPVKVDQTAPEALVAELALAPLAAGDYVLALGGGPKRLLVPLRVVP